MGWTDSTSTGGRAMKTYWVHYQEINSQQEDENDCEMVGAADVRAVLEALEVAEYALSHPSSDQAFALHAVRQALGQAFEKGKADGSAQ
jgi:hypothetical protein